MNLTKKKRKNTLKGFKQYLPTKICLNCNKPFQYRKKWSKNWDKVLYCSNRCKKPRLMES